MLLRGQARTVALGIVLAAVLVAGAGLLGQAAVRSGFANELSSTLPGARWSDPSTLAGGPLPTLAWRSFTAPSGDGARTDLGVTWHLVARTRSGNVTVFTQPGRTLYLVTSDPTSSTVALQRSGGCGSRDASFPEPAPDDWMQFGAAPTQVLAELDGIWPDLEFPACVPIGYWTATDPQSAKVGGVPVARFVPAAAPPRAVLISTHLFISSELGSDPVELGFGQSARLQRLETGGAELRWNSGGAQYRYDADAVEPRAMSVTACRTMRPVFLC